MNIDAFSTSGLQVASWQATSSVVFLFSAILKTTDCEGDIDERALKR